jgi:serine/threonine-protein kinase
LVVGTPPYIPPEIWLGRPADGRSDLYSLGVMLYTLACGTYPFRAKSPKEYAELHLKAAPPDPVTVKPDIGEELGAVIIKLLAKNRADRYATVEEFLGDFEHCRRGTAPDVIRSTGRKIRCNFCEAVMPAHAKKCTVCGEAIGAPRRLASPRAPTKSPAPPAAVFATGAPAPAPSAAEASAETVSAESSSATGLCSACLAIE